MKAGWIQPVGARHLPVLVSADAATGELLGAPVSLFHIPKYLVSTCSVQSSSGPCRYSDEQTEDSVCHVELCQEGTNVACLQGPVQSPFSLPPVMVLPSW